MVGSDAIPTNKLRFVVREEYHETGYDTFVRGVRILQQWWEWHEHGYGHDTIEGEWRDVPLEQERV